MRRVSVVLPAYNAAQFLPAAIESILGQSFEDFECIIVDDASSDNTPEVLAAYADPRIRVIRHEHNAGLPSALNNALDVAEGAFIARMDADDVSFPDRIAQQVAFLESHPEVAIVGTGRELFREQPGDIGQIVLPPALLPEEIQAEMLMKCPLAHPTVMFRREALLEERYDPDCAIEDYDLWVRLMSKFKFANIKKPLLYYRRHDGQISHNKKEGIKLANRKAHRYILENYLELSPAQAQLDLHEAVLSKAEDIDPLALEEWVITLLDQNRKTRFFSDNHFKSVLAKYFLRECLMKKHILKRSGRKALQSISAINRLLENPLNGIDILGLSWKVFRYG